MWKIQQLSELYIEEPGAWETCSDSNGTKALGLKCGALPPALKSRRHSGAFSLPPLSISLLNFTFFFPPQFPHLLSLTLWWSFCLFPCLQFLSFIFPLTTKLPEQLQPKSNPPTPPPPSPPTPLPLSTPPPYPFPHLLLLSPCPSCSQHGLSRVSGGLFATPGEGSEGAGSVSLIFSFNEDAVICLRGLIRRLINTSHLIISLRGAEILKSNGLPRLHHNTHMRAPLSRRWSAVTSAAQYLSHKG